jgi:hypothetical protein
VFTKLLGERLQLGAARLPEHGLDIEPEGELDRFTRGARRRDDDDAACDARAEEGLAIGREIRVAYATDRLVDYCGLATA